MAQLKNKHSKITKKRKIALNRLAALVNLPPDVELTQDIIHNILEDKNTAANTLPRYRQINNSHISELVDTHTSTVQLHTHHAQMLSP